MRSLKHYFKPEVQIILSRSLFLKDYNFQHNTGVFQNRMRSEGLARGEIEEFLCSFKGISHSYARDFVDLFLLEQLIEKDVVQKFSPYVDKNSLRVAFFKSRLKPIARYLEKKYPKYLFWIIRSGYICIRKRKEV